MHVGVLGGFERCLSLRLGFQVELKCCLKGTSPFVVLAGGRGQNIFRLGRLQYGSRTTMIEMQRTQA